METNNEPLRLVRTKPTLLKIRERHGINLYSMWEASGIDDSDIVYMALFKHPIAREDAEKIIMGVNQLVNENYTLETVDIALLSDGEGESNGRSC